MLSLFLPRFVTWFRTETVKVTDRHGLDFLDLSWVDVRSCFSASTFSIPLDCHLGNDRQGGGHGSNFLELCGHEMLRPSYGWCTAHTVRTSPPD